MNKCFLIFLTACILAASPIAASADGIVPWSFNPARDFFLKNKNECKPTGQRQGRSFISNKNNVLSVKEEPGSEYEAGVFKRGEKFTITHTYELKGEDWGIIGYQGWVPMSQVSLVYDSMAFAEEHKDEGYPYTGGYETLEAFEEFVVWEWPGSGVVKPFVVSKINVAIQLRSKANPRPAGTPFS